MTHRTVGQLKTAIIEELRPFERDALARADDEPDLALRAHLRAIALGKSGPCRGEVRHMIVDAVQHRFPGVERDAIERVIEIGIEEGAIRLDESESKRLCTPVLRLGPSVTQDQQGVAYDTYTVGSDGKVSIYHGASSTIKQSFQFPSGAAATGCIPSGNSSADTTGSESVVPDVTPGLLSQLSPIRRDVLRLVLDFCYDGLPQTKFGKVVPDDPYLCELVDCRVHSSLGKTPAQASGLADRRWSIEDLVSLTD